MLTADLSEVARVLRASTAVVVTTHLHPDGDAIGSMLAMYHLLRAMGKQTVVCLNEDPVPSIYRWLPGAAVVTNGESFLPALDLCVILDAAKRDRLGKIAERIPNQLPTVVIDHHLEEAPCGDVNFVDASYAAVGEILTELFQVAGIPLSQEAAICAYVALATDTGGFRFSNTTPRSMRYAATLLEAQFDVAEVCGRVFDTMSSAKFQLLARVVNRARFSREGRIVYSELTLSDLCEVGARPEDLEGLINFTRNVEGVDVAALIREEDAQTTRVSLRAKSEFNAARILQHFGGGGHAAAAGATIKLPLKQAGPMVLAHIQKSLGA